MAYDYFDPDTPVDDQPSPPLGDFTIPSSPQTALGNPLYAGEPVRPGTGPQTQGVDPRVQMASNLLALLMLGGGAAGVGQNLFSRPPSTTISPRLSPQQLALLGGAQGQFGQTGNILGQLMGMLQTPQIPPGLSLLTEQAFQPALGTIAQQAIESARRRGFAGGADLLNTGPGGAIAGPALADLQGQMAQAKLNLYQNQIGNLLGALQGSNQLGAQQGTLAANLPTQQRTQAPQPSILQTLGQAGPILGGVGQLLAAVNPVQGPSAGGGGGGGIGSFLSGLNPMNWF